MCDRKSQTSEMVRSMVHGKPSRRQCSQPGIYDVFNWPQPAEVEKKVNIGAKVRERCAQNCEHEQNYQPQCQYQDGDNRDPVGRCQRQRDENKRYENGQLNQIAEEYQVGKRKQLKPHNIKNELYMYDQVKIKRTTSQQANQNKSDLKMKSSVVQPQKLNEQDQKDKKIIEKRKQKINQFKQFTRDLPNSAFTTYYGRPAFQSYGRCNSSSQLKTHNVMPHRGENNPKVKQTYQSALIKGKNIKVQDHLPRKPIEDSKATQAKPKKPQNIHLPLQKPDLINHIRFSEPRAQSDRKQPVPSHQALKAQLKRSAKPETPKTQKSRKAHDKVSKTALDVSDGLKFMNGREHLIDLIEAKKTKDSRVAYKVTECYPTNALQRSKTESDYDEIDRPAGVAYQRGDPAERVIYRRY